MLFPSAVISSHTSTPSEYMQNGVLITTAGAGSRKVPDRVVNLIIEIWGAGGGGGGSFGSRGAGGGGGGGYSRKSMLVSPDDLIEYLIGSGGGGGIDGGSPTNGDDGGNTTLSTLIAYGGSGGGSAPGVINGTGGVGGSSSGGSINTSGNTGDNGSSSISGAGGASPNGGTGGESGVISLSSPVSGGDGYSPGGGGGGGVGISGGQSSAGNGANGGVRFSWTEELIEDFENLIPPDNLPDGWGATAGVWGPDTINKTFGSQSLRGTSIPFSAWVAYPIPNDWIGKYQKLKVDVRLDSSGEVMVEAFDSDFTNRETKTISTTWTTFEVSIANLSIDNYASFWVHTNDGISCNIDNLRGVL